MLTLRRFKVLAETYGTSLSRWPQAEREEARALLGTSAEARALLDEQRHVDAFIARALDAEAEAFSRQAAEEDIDAALARLRAGIAGRIGRQTRKSFRSTAIARTGVIGGFGFDSRRPAWVATSGGELAAQRVALAFGGLFAVAVGSWLGWTMSSGAPPDLLGALLATPLGSGG